MASSEISEIKGITRRFVEDVWGRGDREVARQIVAPDLVHYRRRRTEPTGIDGLFEGLDLYDHAFPEREFTQDDVIVEGVLAHDRWTMVAIHSGDLLGIPPTGRRVVLKGMNRYRIEDDKIVESWHDEDINGLIEQLGGMPAPPRPTWPPAVGDSYNLAGPQVEPDASFWTVDPCPPPRVIRIEELLERTDHPGHPWYFPPYPGPEETRLEIEELHELASLRDDPEAVVGGEGERRRLAVSPFLQLRPQPFGAVYNRERPESQPVIATGRELARWFESETPGLANRQALSYLLRDANWSPPRQSRVWMALDVVLHSAMLAGWHYKWFTDRNSGPDRVAFRPRPIEVDYRVDVLYNRAVNASGTGDGPRRLQPLPSPGTPRHPSYPSGHSIITGAASEILSYFFPDYTAEFDQLADNAGMARLWAGIHYRSDHLRGVELGRHVAQLVIEQLEAGCVSTSPPPPSTDPSALQPPSPADLQGRADAFRKCCASRLPPPPPPPGEASSAAIREQARGPQRGAAAPASSSKEARSHARGPQKGAARGGSVEASKEKAEGPQEGAGG